MLERGIVLLSLITSILSANPGLRLRITQDGLSYANKVAIQLVTKKITTATIPDQSGEAKNVHYSITGLSIRNFQQPESSITLASESDLKWTATNLALEIDGNFQYKYKKGIIRFSGHGGFSVKFSDISFSVGIQLGVNADGKPTVKTSQCSCDSGPVKVKFHGGLEWIYNLFSGKVAKAISKQFQNKMCGIIQKLVDSNAQKSLETLKVQVPLGKFLTLDYRLLSTPMVRSEYIEGNLKGEIYWTGNKTEAPFAAPSMATITDNKKMIYITLSSYVFNTMTYQAFEHNMLVFNLTSKNLKGHKDALNTTCTSGVCLGKLIPQIGEKFPNCKVEVYMKSSKAPIITITSGSLNITAEGNATLYARKSDNSLHYLFQIVGTGTTSVNISMTDQVLHGRIQGTKVQTKVSDSAIGQINEKALQFLVDSAITTTVTPILNELGAEGIQLPSNDNLQFQNTDFKLLENTILIETDLKFIPNHADKDSTVLRFVPRRGSYSLHR